MNLEHLALQVSDPARMADWYVKHLGCSVARSTGEPTQTRFLLTSNGAVMLEVYRNPSVPVPDYKTMDPLLLHLAFLSEKPDVDRDRLAAAGAAIVEPFAATPAGDHLVMMRDPWGLPLQLVKRVSPMLTR